MERGEIVVLEWAELLAKGANLCMYRLIGGEGVKLRKDGVPDV